MDEDQIKQILWSTFKDKFAMPANWYEINLIETIRTISYAYSDLIYAAKLVVIACDGILEDTDIGEDLKSLLFPYYRE